MGIFGQFWANLGKSGHFGQIWTFWANLGILGNSGHFGQFIREEVKYYFADFVKEVPPILPYNTFGEEGVTDIGGTPWPFVNICPNFFSAQTGL